MKNFLNFIPYGVFITGAILGVVHDMLWITFGSIVLFFFMWIMNSQVRTRSYEIAKGKRRSGFYFALRLRFSNRASLTYRFILNPQSSDGPYNIITLIGFRFFRGYVKLIAKQEGSGEFVVMVEWSRNSSYEKLRLGSIPAGINFRIKLQLWSKEGPYFSWQEGDQGSWHGRTLKGLKVSRLYRQTFFSSAFKAGKRLSLFVQKIKY